MFIAVVVTAIMYLLDIPLGFRTSVAVSILVISILLYILLVKITDKLRHKRYASELRLTHQPFSSFSTLLECWLRNKTFKLGMRERRLQPSTSAVLHGWKVFDSLEPNQQSSQGSFFGDINDP